MSRKGEFSSFIESKRQQVGLLTLHQSVHLHAQKKQGHWEKSGHMVHRRNHLELKQSIKQLIKSINSKFNSKYFDNQSFPAFQ